MDLRWKCLGEHQSHKVSILISPFYNKSKAGCSKEPSNLYNLEIFLDLGYVKLYNLYKLHVAYLEIRGNDIVFVELCVVDSSA